MKIFNKSILILLHKILLYLSPSILFSQFSVEKQSDLFIQYLNNNDKIVEYIDNSELRIPNRLGIQYENVYQKILISYDIDENLKDVFIYTK
jgi:hypothetical protein